MICHYHSPHFTYSSWYHYNLQYCYAHTPDTTVNKFGTLLFCSSSVVHIYHTACLYIGQHLYEIKWTVPLTFRPWEGHNFVIDLGATREVSRFSPKMEVWTQKEAPFSNSGETSTFFPTEQHPKAIKNGQVCCQNHQTCERSLFRHLVCHAYFCCNRNSSGLSQYCRYHS